MGKFKDLTGKVFGKLTVIKRTEPKIKGKSFWDCKCDCGNVKSIVSYSLGNGDSISCGKCNINKWSIYESYCECSVSRKNGEKILFTIDLEDYEKIKKHQWYISKTGYAKTKIKNKDMSVHRLITNCDSNLTVDHIDNDKLNNKKSNLRMCTMAQNNMNKKNLKQNISGYRGVHWHKTRKKWVAQISINNKIKYLGIFEKIEDAIKRRKESEQIYYGEYAHKEAK